MLVLDAVTMPCPGGAVKAVGYEMAPHLNFGFGWKPTFGGKSSMAWLRRKRSPRRRDQAAISLNSMVSGVWWTCPPRLGRPRPLLTDPIANLQCDLPPKKWTGRLR